MQSVLFVCTGNICRSPTADGIMRKMVADAGLDWVVDSAGTHNYHIGEAPDARSQRTALGRGYDLSELRARKVTREDFHHYDLILAMDADHHHALELLRPKDGKAELALFLEYAGMGKADVPDPYYGTSNDFDHVLTLVEDACMAIIERHGQDLPTHRRGNAARRPRDDCRGHS